MTLDIIFQGWKSSAVLNWIVKWFCFPRLCWGITVVTVEQLAPKMMCQKRELIHCKQSYGCDCLCIPMACHTSSSNLSQTDNQTDEYWDFSIHPTFSNVEFSWRWIICSFRTDFYHFKAFKWCPEISLMKPIPNLPKIRNVPILWKVILNGFEWQVNATAFVKANIRRLYKISE